MRTALVVLVTAVSFFVAGCGTKTEDAAPTPAVAPPISAVTDGTVTAADGVTIHYDVRGAGDVAVVFVHCWSCSRAFWREQLDVFKDDYRVVSLDLGGHGASGAERDPFTVTGLAGDVVAVADGLDLQKMILVGHSMGGPVSLEAAHRMPGRVAGIIAVDTLQNADFKYPQEIFDNMVASLEADFKGTMAGFFQGMASPSMNEELKAWIVDEASAARPEVAIALMSDFAGIDMPALFQNAGVPIRAINSAPQGERGWATDVEANRKYSDFDAVLMEGAGHFLQLERPEEFNRHLKRVLTELAAAPTAAFSGS
jgi:pimeloyl-ACP methyl ester carboxylesterase